MSRMRDALRRAVTKLEARPRGKIVTSVVSSARASWFRREPVWVRRLADGAWVHRFRGGVIVASERGTASPRDWEASTRDYFYVAYQPNHGDTIVDVGAGIGTEMLAFSRAVGANGRVVCLEAHPGTFDLLRKNAQLNRLANVDLVLAAATDEPGDVRIGGDDATESNSLLTSELDPEAYTVPGVRLDDIVTSHAIEHIDFLKMNIEGAERLAIKGMDQTIARTDRVCICCHDFLADRGGPETMRTRKLVTSYLQERGFSVLDNDPAWLDYQRDHVHAIGPAVSTTSPHRSETPHRPPA